MSESVAERLLLVSQVSLTGGSCPLMLDQPVWIEAGDTYGFDVEQQLLLVRDSAGRTHAYPGRHRCR